MSDTKSSTKPETRALLESAVGAMIEAAKPAADAAGIVSFMVVGFAGEDGGFICGLTEVDSPDGYEAAAILLGHAPSVIEKFIEHGKVSERKD